MRRPLRTLVLVVTAATNACGSTSPGGTAPGGTSVAPSSAASLTAAPALPVTAASSSVSWHDATWTRHPIAWDTVALTSAPRPSPRWTLRIAEAGADQRAVFGTSRSDVWIGSANGSLLRTRDGGTTFQRARLDDGEGVTSIWAVDPNDVWVLGEHHLHRIENGALLATLSARLDNHGHGRVWGVSANELWIASGRLVHTDDSGASWTPLDLGAAQATSDVWARSRSDVWVEVPFGVLHGTDAGATWAPTSLLISVEDSFHVRGAGASEVWIVGAFGGPAVSENGGASWRRSELPSRRSGAPPTTTWTDLWPTAGAVWAATSAGLWSRMRSGPWQRALETRDVSSLWASGPNDVWAVGRMGQILHGG